MNSRDDWQVTERVRASARSGRGDPFAAAVRATRMAMIVTDPRRDDNPIVFANDAFLDLTGYSRLEVLGRNCRFLQGPETDLDVVGRVQAAVRAERDVHCELLNYRKDGSTFHNALFVSPVHDLDGTLLFFFASQLDVSDRYVLRAERDRTRAALEANALLLREIGHRARNDLQMVSAMLALQSNGSAHPAAREALAQAIHRVDALATLYRVPEGDRAERDLADLAREVGGLLVSASGRDDIALDLDLTRIPLRGEAAAPLALIVNETVSNALHRAVAGRPGRIALRVAQAGDEAEVRIEDDGASASPAGPDGFGATLVEILTRQLDGRRSIETGAQGSRVTFHFPLDRVGA